MGTKKLKRSCPWSGIGNKIKNAICCMESALGKKSGYDPRMASFGNKLPKREYLWGEWEQKSSSVHVMDWDWE